jgi:hypothetical protein
VCVCVCTHTRKEFDGKQVSMCVCVYMYTYAYTQLIIHAIHIMYIHTYACLCSAYSHTHARIHTHAVACNSSVQANREYHLVLMPPPELEICACRMLNSHLSCAHDVRKYTCTQECAWMDQCVHVDCKVSSLVSIHTCMHSHSCKLS